MDDHVAMQVIGKVKLFPTAWMGANFGPSFPVDQVDVILEAADGYIDLTAALVRTVEHLQHPVLLCDGALSAPLGPGGHNEEHNC